MSTSQRQIFRQQALEQYRQRREKDILPPWLHPRVAVFLWILICLLLGICVLLYSVHVPTLITVPGVVIQEQAPQGDAHAGDVFAVLFLSLTQYSSLHRKLPVTIHLGNSGIVLHQSLTLVEPEVSGPEAILKRFHFQGVQSQMLSGPQVIALVRLGSPQLARALVGSLCQADIQVGSRRVLSLVPILGPIFPR